MVQIFNFEVAVNQFHLAAFGIYIPEDDFYLENVKLCRSKKGSLYLKLPQYKKTDGNWVNICNWGEKKAKEINEDIKKLLREEGKIDQFLSPPPTSEVIAPF
jgi:hypothetical protein